MPAFQAFNSAFKKKYIATNITNEYRYDLFLPQPHQTTTPKAPTTKNVEWQGRALESFRRKTRNSFVRGPAARTSSLPSLTHT
jgi:hypothetical protein